MEKKAKLVTVLLMTRVIVRSDAKEEEIWSAALPRLFEAIRNGGMDNMESIEDDEQCPYDDMIDGTSSHTIGSNTSQPVPRNARLIGYRIESKDGLGNIPLGLYSFFVLSEPAADYWLEIDRLQPSGDWIKVPVYTGDIDEPVMLNNITHPDDPECKTA